MQTCVGFLRTLVTIHLIAWLAETAGWRWAFAFLAPGPPAGFVAMARLRASPDAARIAGGRRRWLPQPAAASASSSLRRFFTLADLSWPQAAEMSWPRGVRTGLA